MSFAARWAQKNVPRRSTFVMVSNISGETSRKGINFVMPALLTSTSMFPNSRSNVSNIGSISSSLVRSAFMAIDLLPRARTFSTVSFACSSLPQ